MSPEHLITPSLAVRPLSAGTARTCSLCWSKRPGSGLAPYAHDWRCTDLDACSRRANWFSGKPLPGRPMSHLAEEQDLTRLLDPHETTEGYR